MTEIDIYNTQYGNKSFENSIQKNFMMILQQLLQVFKGLTTNITDNPFFMGWAFTGSDADFILTNKDIEGGV